MKPPVDDSTHLLPINECPLGLSQPNLAHSKGKPDVSSTTTKISVRFATPTILRIPIQAVEIEAEWQDKTEAKALPATRYQVLVGGKSPRK